MRWIHASDASASAESRSVADDFMYAQRGEKNRTMGITGALHGSECSPFGGRRSVRRIRHDTSRGRDDEIIGHSGVMCWTLPREKIVRPRLENSQVFTFVFGSVRVMRTRAAHRSGVQGK